MAQQEDLSEDADERMGIEVRRDGMKKYLQEAGIYQQLVKSMVRMYHGRKNPAVKQGMEGLKSGLGASDEEVAEVKAEIERLKGVLSNKEKAIKKLKNSLKELRGYSFEQLLTFRDILSGDLKVEPVPEPPLPPIQNCMYEWLKKYQLAKMEIRTRFEQAGFIRFAQFMPYLPTFLMTDDIKERLDSKRLEWKEVVVPDTDEYGNQKYKEQVDEEGNPLMETVYELDPDDPMGEAQIAVEKPLPPIALNKKYYYNRANKFTTFIRPEVLGEEEEEEEAKEGEEGAVKKKRKGGFKLFDYLNVQKDLSGKWTATTKTKKIKKKVKKKKVEETVEYTEGGYEPCYVVAVNVGKDGEETTYDLNFGYREESTTVIEMCVTYDDEGNELPDKIPIEKEVIGAIAGMKGVKAEFLAEWKVFDVPKGLKQMKQKKREAWMKEHFISTSTVGSTKREINFEQTDNINDFVKEQRDMRRATKMMKIDEENKILAAIEAKKPAIRKEHYKKLNKKLKEVLKGSAMKSFRKEICVALGLLDDPAKQMRDRLPKILKGLYGQENELDDDKNPVMVEGEPKKTEKWKKGEMGQVVKIVFDNNREKFDDDILYQLQGIAGWKDWVDSADLFKQHVQEVMKDWVEQAKEQAEEVARKEAEEEAKRLAALYPEKDDGGVADWEMAVPDTSEDAEEGDEIKLLEDAWTLYFDMRKNNDGIIAEKDRDEVFRDAQAALAEGPSMLEKEEFDEEEDYPEISKLWAEGWGSDEMTKTNLFEWLQDCLDPEKGIAKLTTLQHVWVVKEAVGMPHP